MAEWPCCHDPLRFSPSRSDSVPPPTAPGGSNTVRPGSGRGKVLAGRRPGQVRGKAWRPRASAGKALAGSARPWASVAKAVARLCQPWARPGQSALMERLGNLGRDPGKCGQGSCVVLFREKGPPLAELLKLPALLLRGTGEVSGVVSRKKAPVGGTLGIARLAP